MPTPVGHALAGVAVGCLITVGSRIGTKPVSCRKPSSLDVFSTWWLPIFVFAFLGRPELPLRIASRIVLIPFIAGVAFELIRVLSTRVDRPVARLLLKPGLWLQSLTTRPPTPEQIEVAIVAMSEVLKSEDEHTLVSRPLQPPLEYRT